MSPVLNVDDDETRSGAPRLLVAGVCAHCSAKPNLALIPTRAGAKLGTFLAYVALVRAVRRLPPIRDRGLRGVRGPRLRHSSFEPASLFSGGRAWWTGPQGPSDRRRISSGSFGLPWYRDRRRFPHRVGCGFEGLAGRRYETPLSSRVACDPAGKSVWLFADLAGGYRARFCR